MKKILILSLPLLLASCFSNSSSKDVEDVKKELLGETTKTEQTKNNEDNTITEEKEDKNFEIKYSSDNSYISNINVNFVDRYDSSTSKVEIKGTAKSNVDKIIIEFENPSSNFEKDEYRLKQFKKGDTDFTYNAFRDFSVLDNGVNTYTIKAYVGSDFSTTILDVKIPLTGANNSEEEIESNLESFGTTEESFFSLSLPTGNDIGSPLTLTGGAFTYTNINDFEVNKITSNNPNPIDIQNISCTDTSVLTSTLIDKFGYAYWNTCRPMGENGLSYFVLTINGDKYSYSKHYVDKKNSLYGTILIEEGLSEEDSVNKSNIKEKNKEYKIKDFESFTRLSDKVFNYLTK